MSRIFFTLLFILAALSGFAQNRPNPQHSESENLLVPADWKVRPDHQAAGITVGDTTSADIFFVNMTPGWHITTGPAAIFYLPGNTVSGDYKVTTKIHLFDPKGRQEAFGFFIGGKNLENNDQSYTYFLLRNSGEYLIKKREGSHTQVIKQWTAAPQMNRYTEATKSSVPNTLQIEVRDDQVHFYINSEKVLSLPRSTVDTDGHTGLRINHALNIHVESLAVTEL